MRKKYSILLIIALFTSVCFGQEKVRVAVMETQGTADAAKREEIRNALTDGILNNKNYILVERSALAQILKEKALQASDHFDENTQVELGKMAGAKYVCVSSFNSANGYEYRLTYRLVDVGTGETLEGTRFRENVSATDFYNIIDKISASKLFAQNEENSNTPSASICGFEIQKEDLPNGEKIPEGWRLPTLKELKCMCENKDKIGGFNFGTYMSSTKEKGYNKGIKFQFCDEVFITGSASVRLVRGVNSTAQNEEDTVATDDTQKSKVSETMDKVKIFVKKKSESENKPNEASELERIKLQQEQEQAEQKRQQEIVRIEQEKAEQERQQAIAQAEQERKLKIEADKKTQDQAKSDASTLKQAKRHNVHGFQIMTNILFNPTYMVYHGGEFIAGYRFNPNIFVGGGISFYQYFRVYDSYSGSSIDDTETPLFANFRLNFTKTVLSPYIELSGGYAINNEKLFYSAVFGVEFNLNGNLALNGGVGYNNYWSDGATLRAGLAYTFNRYKPAKQ